MKLKRKKLFKQNIFHKLLITSSITIVATVTVLIVTITNYYSDVIIKREMDINTRTMERVNDYFVNKDADIDNLIRNLYGQGDLISDVSYALHNGFEDYIKYRLDNFTESSSFIPRNIDTFFNGYFKQDPDINAVSLRSEETPSIEYLFIYNFSRWNQSIVNYPLDYSTMKEEQPIQQNTIPERELKNTFIRKVSINNPVDLSKMGELSVYYSDETLNHILKKEKAEVKSSFFILGTDGKVIFTLNQGVPDHILDNIPVDMNESTIKLHGETYYINSFNGGNKQRYISIIPKKELNGLTFVQGTMWLLIIFLTFIAIFLTYSFMRNYSARIKLIDSSIREVEKGNLGIRIPESNKEDELSAIAVSFNSMLDELNNYIDRVYMLNIKQQEAELKALQSQINPHFLFNTLEVIRMAAVVDGSKTASKMIYHLSRLFRYTLDSKELVPLHNEVENANQYLRLIQLHYPNKLTVEIDIPKAIENISVQKLILQPIIENYVVHGFRKDRDDNKLEISAVKKDYHIEIYIKDNGKGISDDKLKEIMEYMNMEEGAASKSIGLKNVHQRLKLKHGKQYGINLQSVEGNETIVTILIPKGGV